MQKDGDPFDILSNLEDRVMKAYRLFFEVPADLSDIYKLNFGVPAEYKGEGRYVLLIRGTFVIDRGAIIRAAYADPDYRQRMEPAAISTALDASNGSGEVAGAALPMGSLR